MRLVYGNSGPTCFEVQNMRFHADTLQHSIGKKVMNIKEKIKLINKVNGGICFATVSRMFGINESTAH
ncbi:hypothetical protein T4B_3068 [Trichinella pseudospiralis]|uniref:HTH psq-type domain-containing protein n=1 Tax=Trichinella pseudospiralis TaxID=6337 RepID=A0A0V1JHB0_TRIPS|nr:hypothetical protein T4B_3068 [Trichinella pseudospiralis]